MINSSMKALLAVHSDIVVDSVVYSFRGIHDSDHTSLLSVYLKMRRLNRLLTLRWHYHARTSRKREWMNLEAGLHQYSHTITFDGDYIRDYIPNFQPDVPIRFQLRDKVSVT